MKLYNQFMEQQRYFERLLNKIALNIDYGMM